MTTIHDGQGLFDSSAIARINATRWPFDLHVVTGTFSSRDALERVVHDEVTGPTVLAIGIDRDHHFTSVHFGVGTHVAVSARDAIGRAGNASFKAGDFAGGVLAIGDASAAAIVRAESHVGVASTAPAPVEHGSWWPWALAFGVVVSVAAVAIWLVRRSSCRDREQLNRMTESLLSDDLADFDRRLNSSSPPTPLRTPSPSYQPSPRYSSPVQLGSQPAVTTTPSYRPEAHYSSAPPIIVNNPIPVIHNYGNNSNDLLTGLLIGESLADHRVERERVVERTVIEHSSSDSGSSGSSWDSDSSSSSSFDDSSSSSSWDSGDSGSGFDGGSSGGDW